MDFLKRLFRPEPKKSDPESSAEKKSDEGGSMLNFADRPYSLGQPNDEYLAFGESLSQISGVDGEKSKIKIDNILNLTDPKVLAHLDVKAEELIKQPYEIHHILGHVARRGGFRGILAPTPLGPDRRVLIIFK